MSLKKKLEAIEKEVRNLTSPVDEYEKVLIVQLLAPLSKSNQVVLEEGESSKVTPEETDRELSKEEIESRLNANEKKALNWLRENVDLRKCSKALVFVTPWEWLVQVPELNLSYLKPCSLTTSSTNSAK